MQTQDMVLDGEDIVRLEETVLSLRKELNSIRGKKVKTEYHFYQQYKDLAQTLHWQNEMLNQARKNHRRRLKEKGANKALA